MLHGCCTCRDGLRVSPGSLYGTGNYTVAGVSEEVDGWYRSEEAALQSAFHRNDADGQHTGRHHDLNNVPVTRYVKGVVSCWPVC